MNPFSPLLRIPRMLAIIAAWATCLSPMLVEGPCCCAKELVVSNQVAVDAKVAPEVRKSCCSGHHGTQLQLASKKSADTESPASVDSRGGSHRKQACECTLSCCQPEVLVLANAPNFAEREWVCSPAPAILYNGSVSDEGFAARGAVGADVGRLPVTDSISYCALLCRWRN